MHRQMQTGSRIVSVYAKAPSCGIHTPSNKTKGYSLDNVLLQLKFKLHVIAITLFVEKMSQPHQLARICT